MGFEVMKEGGNALVLLLRLIAISGEGFPPLKGAVQSALYVIDSVDEFNSNKRLWRALGEYVGRAMTCIVKLLPDAKLSRDDLIRNMDTFQFTLEQVGGRIKEIQKKGGVARFWKHLKGNDAEEIAKLRQKVQDAFSLFQLESAITVGLDVAEIRYLTEDITNHLKRMNEKFTEKIATNLNLSTLTYTEGASWNPNRVCLPGTRQSLLGDIWKWIDDADIKKTAEIYLLSDVAGAGKSAIAHTVAKQCYEKGFLFSSFFFDREVAGRNNASRLVTTLARDLSKLSKRHAELISLAIEQEPGLAMAQSPSLQFMKLIVEPLRRYPIDAPIVSVIDALDEGCDDDLLAILRDDVPKLPGHFRIFMTSRPQEHILSALMNKSHIRFHSINIYDSLNRTDIAVYAKHRLKDVAQRKNLGTKWPSQDLLNKFTAKAEGLFIWVSTVCDCLLYVTYPEKKFNSLLADDNLAGVGAEKKMINLYSTILSTCNWDDEDFCDGYQLVMGAIMAVKTPLSMSSLQSLHRKTDLRVSDIVQPLATVLTGVSQVNEPVRVLHLSFRTFVTIQTRTLPELENYYVDEKSHSQRLALLCLLVLYEDLSPGTPGTGYLSSNLSSMLSKIPEVGQISPPELLWYACRFLIDHLVEVDNTFANSSEFIDMLRSSLTSRLIPWLEITSAKGTYQNLKKIRAWLQETFSNDTQLLSIVDTPKIAEYLVNLSWYLFRMGRREESLQAIEDAVVIYRKLASEKTTYAPNLASALIVVSSRLSDLGSRVDALQAIQEAMDLRKQHQDYFPPRYDPELAAAYNALSRCQSELGRRSEALESVREAVRLRRLLVSHSSLFKPDLATSLNTLSARLSEAGKKIEALEAVQEAVQLREELAKEYPDEIAPDLATSLNTLSARLSGLDRREEALKAVHEAVRLRRKLAEEHPAAFIPHLASSLNTMSARLSELGRKADAVQASTEAVKLSRELAADRPAAFTPQLAMTLNTMSARLSELGRPKEALEVVKEAVKLRRELAKEQPVAFRNDLAVSLHTLARRYLDQELYAEARTAAEEAVMLRKQLAKDHPSSVDSRLAGSLDILSSSLSKLGLEQQALETREEALKIRSKIRREK